MSLHTRYGRLDSSRSLALTLFSSNGHQIHPPMQFLPHADLPNLSRTARALPPAGFISTSLRPGFGVQSRQSTVYSSVSTIVVWLSVPVSAARVQRGAPDTAGTER